MELLVRSSLHFLGRVSNNTLRGNVFEECLAMHLSEFSGSDSRHATLRYVTSRSVLVFSSLLWRQRLSKFSACLCFSFSAHTNLPSER